jgi:hypothetical protein
MQVRFFSAVSNSESSNADELHSAFGDTTPLPSDAAAAAAAAATFLFCLATTVGIEDVQQTCGKYGFDYVEETGGILEVASELYDSQHRAVRLPSEPFFGLVGTSS